MDGASVADKTRLERPASHPAFVPDSALSRLIDRLPLERLGLQAGVFLLLGMLLFAVVVVVPAVAFDVPAVRQDQGKTRPATVSRVLEEGTRTGPRGGELYQKLEVEFDGRTTIIEKSDVEQDARRLHLVAGDRVLVNSPAGVENETYFIVDRVRNSQLWLFGLSFAALVIVVGRWRGAMSLVGMAASLIVILRFVIPGIVSGRDPVIISVVGALVIMLLTLFLSHGLNRKTTTALLGTTVALALTAGLSSVAIALAALSGLADEQSAMLNIMTAGGINPEGLLLAGMIIGALGVLDDVTVAQASAVFELKRANPLLGARALFGRAMNIGRDHIASTVNTLFLAYAGAALPLLILFSLQTEPASVLVSREFLATEIIRTLVGSIGIVASVPFTTALAAAASRMTFRFPE